MKGQNRLGENRHKGPVWGVEFKRKEGEFYISDYRLDNRKNRALEMSGRRQEEEIDIQCLDLEF